MKLSSKTKKIEPSVLKLLDGTRSVYEVSKILKVSTHSIKKIASFHNLQTDRNSKKNEKIRQLFEEGLLYRDIAKKVGLSESSIRERVRSLGLHRYKFKKEFYIELTKKIEQDFQDGLSYEEIKEKHCLTTTINQGLRRFGLKLFTTHRQRRDIEIVDRYKKQIAKKILVSNDKKIKDPRKIMTLSHIYTISTENNFKKYPNIGSRFHGGIFLSKKILNIIKNKRENEKKSFSEIAEFLNSKNYLTATGVPFSSHNVRFKYLAIKKNKL